MRCAKYYFPAVARCIRVTQFPFGRYYVLSGWVREEEMKNLFDYGDGIMDHHLMMPWSIVRNSIWRLPISIIKYQKIVFTVCDICYYYHLLIN